MFAVIVGPAGVGKTSVAKKLAEYGIFINLDPASPTKADVDIRNWVKTEEVQKKYKLGINGALLKSMELVASSDDWILEDKNEFKVVDTPGQLEIFLYHDYGKKVIEKMAEHDAVALLFVVDATEIQTIENYLAILAQNAMINLKLMAPCVTAINKIDLVNKEKIMEFLDRERLEELLEKGDALQSLAKGLVDYIEYTSLVQRPLLISAKTGEGIYDVYSALHEVHCSCGDLS